MIIIGHRGVNVKVFENTVESVKKAIEMKLDMIEIDIQMTKDNIIVVCHDNFLLRLLNQPLFIDQMTYKELQKYKLPNGETIPTLKDIIKLVDGKIVLNIEIKPNNKEICIELKKVIHFFKLKGWTAFNFLISSYNLSILEEMNKIDLHHPYLALIQGNILENKDYYYSFIKKILQQ